VAEMVIRRRDAQQCSSLQAAIRYGCKLRGVPLSLAAGPGHRFGGGAPPDDLANVAINGARHDGPNPLSTRY